MDRDIFDEPFVLEAANNHWGRIDRGLEIVQIYGALVRHHNIRAAIKFQFRDRETFIHKNHKTREDIRYIKKTESTWLTQQEIEKLVDKVKNVSCLPMATPFDEKSVELCAYFEFPIIKVASSDINDWPLLESIAKLKRPVIVSTGGASVKDIDDVYNFFEHRKIALAINHCVSLYPSEDSDLELSQIAYLKKRYPNITIGYSSHEKNSWETSMNISYALGARTWERHIDIPNEIEGVAPYCTLPEKADDWFKAFKKTKEMLGNSFEERRVISESEKVYLDQLVRGIYAKKTLTPGLVIDVDNFDEYLYLAIPLQKGQLSCREVLNGTKVTDYVNIDDPLTVNNIDGVFSNNPHLRSFIEARGV